MTQDQAFLRRAIELSLESVHRGGGPFGALVVRGSEIVGEGRNRVTESHDPTAHAEVLALRAAGQHLGTHDLSGCTLYTSCEPCPMCLAATYWARIDTIHYANSRQDAAAIGFDDDFLYRELPLPLEQRRIPLHRALAPEALEVFKTWFASPDRRDY